MAKKLIVLFCLIFVLFPGTAFASVYTVYKGGNINDEIQGVKDALEGVPVGSDPTAVIVDSDTGEPDTVGTTASWYSFEIPSASVNGSDASEGISNVYNILAESKAKTIYNTYDQGLISDSYLSWARGLLGRVPIGKDYVFARVGQYQYIFAIGDFKDGFNGGGKTVDVYSLMVATYNTSYSYSYYTDSSFVLNTGNGLVYSSVSPYPTLTGADFSYSLNFLIPFGICLLFGWWFFRFVFESLKVGV